MTAAQLTAILGTSHPAPGWRGMRSAIAKAGITCAVLALLAIKLDPANIYQHLSAIDLKALALAAAILALQYVLACARWFYILRRLDLPVDRRRAVYIYGMGALANMLLLVSIAGISVRALMLIRQGADLARAAAALAVERIAALGGLLACFALAVVPGYSLARPLLGNLNVTGLALSGVALSAVLIAGAILVLRIAAVRRFLRDLRDAFASRSDAVLLGLSSIVVIYLGFAGIAALASGMGIVVGFLELVTVLPLVAFAAALPVSFGGWGMREGAMVGSLTLFHVAPDAAFALSVTYGLLGIAVVSLLGGFSALLGSPPKDLR